MFYVDRPRTATRRDSSLVTKRYSEDLESNQSPTTRLPSTWGPSTTNLYTDSTTSLGNGPRASVRTEIVMFLYESMLNNIVNSWKTIDTKVYEEDEDFSKELSDVIIASKKKKPGRTFNTR